MKEQLKRLGKLAYNRFQRNESLTTKEVVKLFNLLSIVFGDKEASGFLNLCLTTVKEKHKENREISFDQAVTETLVILMKKEKWTKT